MTRLVPGWKLPSSSRLQQLSAWWASKMGAAGGVCSCVGRCCWGRASLRDKGTRRTQGDPLMLWGPLLRQGLSQDHSSPAAPQDMA